MGELAEAERVREAMDELIRQVRPAELPVIQFVPRCYLHLLRGELDLAKPILDQARVLIAERGISYLLPVVQVYNLLYAVLTGDNTLARELAGLMRNQLDGTATPLPAGRGRRAPVHEPRPGRQLPGGLGRGRTGPGRAVHR